MVSDAPLAVISGMAFEAKIVHGPGIITVYGLNPSKLTADIEQAIKQGAMGLLSFGTAAGLSPSLTPGTAVIAQNVLWQQQSYAANAKWVIALKQLLPQAILADMAGVDDPIVTVQEKSQLHMTCGAVLADMESHLVARIAERYNLPFAVLRVVLDSAECSLPPAAIVAAKPNGTIGYGKVLGSLLAYPQQLPALIRLAACQGQAKKTLLRCSHLLRTSLFGFVNLR